MIRKILPSLLTVLGLILIGVSANAQLNYTVSFPTVTYGAVTGTSPTLDLAYPLSKAAADGISETDEGAANGVVLPFPFKFNGLTYTACNISSNGFITLGSSIIDTLDGYYANSLNFGPVNFTSSTTYVTIPNSRPVIAPLWDDLDMQLATNIVYTTTGASPNRIFTVQWSNAKWNWSASSSVISFQVKLYEVDNSISFHYRPITGGTVVSGSASVGIADILTGTGNFISISGLATGATSSTTTETSITAKPTASTFQVKFTPVAPPAIDAGVTLIAAPVVSTCISATQSVKYTIKNAGTSNIAPGAATVNLTLSGVNTGTYFGSNTKTLAFNEFDTITISGINVNNSGTTVFTGIVSLAGDTKATNDTSRYSYATAKTISSFPAVESAENTPLDVLPFIRTLAGSRNLWSIKAGYKNADLSDSIPPKDGGVNYLFDCWSGTNSAGFSGRLYSHCLQLPAGLPADKYSLDFWLTHDTSYSTNLDSMYVTVSTDKGLTWTTIGGYQRYDASFMVAGWKQETLPLSAYAGQTIQIAFEGVSDYGNSIGLDKITVTANYPLPITLSIFTGTREGNKNILNWSTATEVNNKGFELQRSVNGKDFSAISFIDSKSQNGNSSSANNYSFVDEKPFTGTNYYRLRQLDKDGKATLSNVVVLKSTQIKAEISRVFPNPVQDKLNIVLNAVGVEKITISITDLAGKTIALKSIETVNGDNNISFNTSSLASGTYVIKVNSSSNSELATQKFVK